MQLNAPAKINLFFRILGKRKDGYHEISSLCQVINFCDKITLRPASEDSFSCDHPEVPKEEKNLIVQSLHFFRQVTGKLQPVSIHLEKKIPIGRGFGGGSSNAATVLWGLNELMRKPLSCTQLKLLGSKLGADIPLFFSHGTAYCTGFGERVEDISALPNQAVYLAWPGYGLSTPKVYGAVNLKHLSTEKPEELLAEWKKKRGLCLNDLETPAFLLKPELKQFKEMLQTVPFKQVAMTGSGSAFFCLGFSEPPHEGSGQLVQFLNRNSESWY